MRGTREGETKGKRKQERTRENKEEGEARMRRRSKREERRDDDEVRVALTDSAITPLVIILALATPPLCRLCWNNN
jgi:hypothetical protein